MQLQITDHISQLLFDHECVIVPGFGAFLTRYYSAEVNPATHMMRPPGKRVYFNRSIRDNDGLLAKAVSLAENISYELALARIEESKGRWEEQLVNGEKLNLAGIGRLYIDASSKTLQFSPSLQINYLPEAYGLSIFRSPAIQREAQIRKSIQQSIDRHITAPVAKSKKERRSIRLPWAAVLGPLIFASILGSSYLALQNDQVQEMASFNWFEGNKKGPVEMSTPAATEAEATEATDVPSEKSAPEKVAAKSAAEMLSPPATEKESAVAEQKMIQGGFHIIVGAFGEEANAQSYVQQLQAKGYEAYSTGRKNGLNRVAVGNYRSRTEALQAINDIRLKVNSGAWVYAN